MEQNNKDLNRSKIKKHSKTTNIELIADLDFDTKKKMVNKIVKDNNFNNTSLHKHHVKKSSIILASVGILIIIILILGVLFYRFVIYPKSN
ncbi:hypothetical protein [Mycoplasma crocodyli]|uniref:hypothetical protein n=1 Tax=Mycoplasma crocodyli TaxID=50052 RepID=UPI00031EBA9E|nr:hypothetical protein [Mycoplasma crocodyli]